MENKMSLEEYKIKIYDWMIKELKYSIDVANKLMNEYDNDFREFLDDNLSVQAAAYGMASHLL